MLEFLHNFFTAGYFIPHGHCYLWKPGLVSLHVVADMLIGLAYYSIPITLFYFVKKRSDLPYNAVFLLFAAFIVACGTTHFIEVWTLWHPTYWFAGAVKAITALVSVYTAGTLVYLIPQALALPSPAQLKTANQELQQQIVERQKAEAALRCAHDELEIRVRERTAELESANQALQAEICERQRAEIALQHITTLQQAILNSANYSIISTNVDGTILTFNAAAEKWLGYTATEIIGKTTPVIIHDISEIVQRAQELSQEFCTTIEPGFEAFVAKARLGDIDEREWSYIRKDGSRFSVLLSITALRDHENNITGFLGIGSDISARKQVESALLANEQLLRTVLDILPVGVWIADKNGQITQVNSAAQQIWSGARYVGIEEYNQYKGWWESTGRQIEIEEWALFRAITRGESSLNEVIKIQCFDGTYKTVLNSALPIRDADNNIRGAVVVNQDITNIKRTEEELRAMSNALESAVEGIAQLDTNGRYTKVNPAYANILGYQPEELIAKEWQPTVYVEDQAKMIAAYQQMLANGKIEVEVQGVRKDNSVFDKQVTMVKAYNPQQEFIGHYCFMKDVSDRREIERLKDEFVSVVSHELRTPLTSISGALDLLASGILNTQLEEQKRMLKIAANNTDRLIRLINDILDIERIESGKIQMTKQICDVADLMLQSVETVEEIAQSAEITLSVSSIQANIWVDSDRIIQVFTNLLSNAIKFSSPGATIWLSAEIKKNTLSPHILFKVQDQGRGIPADKIESIFERFQQVDASDSRQKGGTGLGLAICRSILQHHDGQIWAESTLSVGSTFFFTLPMLPESCDNINSQQRNAPLILQCDDDPDIRTVVQAMLERQGYRVLTVASGQETVDMAVQQHPAVIILNLMMPGMDGWETLTVLKQQKETQNIPVIILSGLLPDVNQSLLTDVSDWIVKPPNFKLLCQALDKALAKNNQSIKVLIVEDDQDLAQVLITMFNRHGIETYHASTGTEALQISQNIIPDLLVLDLSLPEYDGFAVVNWLRQHNILCRVPLVVYTAKDLNETERQRLQLGQTIYLTKGRISPQEFEQRVIILLNHMIQ
jgi:PAS domain S-box-containing protein